MKPGASTIRSRQTVTETYSGDGTPVGGIPGASSNLPPLTSSTTVSGTQLLNYQRYETTTNYEFTQSDTHEIVAPGAIQRLSVAVMVDITRTQMITPLRTAIAAAAGIDFKRGDTLAVEPLMFDRTYSKEQEAEIQMDTLIDLFLKVGAVVGAVILPVEFVVFQIAGKAAGDAVDRNVHHIKTTQVRVLAAPYSKNFACGKI